MKKESNKKKGDTARSSKESLPLKKRIFALLVCFPFYFIYLIGEWYESQGSFGILPTFSFRGNSLEYWGEVLAIIFNNRNFYSWGNKQQTKALMVKRRRRFIKKLKKYDLPEETLKNILRLNKIQQDTTLEFWIEEQVGGSDPVDIELRIHRYGGWSDSDRYFGFLMTGQDIVTYYYNDDAWLKNKFLSAETDLDDLVKAKERFVSRPTSIEEAEEVLRRLADERRSDWWA